MKHLFDTNIAKVCGIEEAVILENIYFWCKKNEANNKLTNGKPWTYNSVKAFNTIFDYLSPSKISRALKNLETNGYIEIDEFNANSYDHTKWYCITDKTRKAFGEENEKSNFQNEKSNNDFDDSIIEKSKITITDINTNNNPDTNTNSDDDFPEPEDYPVSQNNKSASADVEKKNNRRFAYSLYTRHHSQIYNELRTAHIIEDKPIDYNYGLIAKRMKALLANSYFTEDKILQGITNAKNDPSCIKNGFLLEQMLTEANMTRLINKCYITTTNPKSDYQKRRESDMERGNMNTGNKNYKLY